MSAYLSTFTCDICCISLGKHVEKKFLKFFQGDFLLDLFFVYCKYLIPSIPLPSWLGLENTPTASLQRGKAPPTSVLDMTLNNLMVRF